MTGLVANHVAQLRLTSTDATGTRWASSQSFVADRRGDIELPATGPAAGNLISSMLPVTASSSGSYIWDSRRSFTLSVLVGGTPVTSTTFSRGAAPGVTEQPVSLSSAGFVGQFWLPPGDRTARPSILLFSGSGGGLPGRLLSAELASHGYPTLALAYFGAAGLPATLADIPLEYFANAMRWLDRQPATNPHDVWVMGISRGSEAALLLGVYFSDLVHGVVAAVPSDAAICSYPGCTSAAWTLHGQPLPYTTQFDNPQPTDHPDAVIPVQRIPGPIFLDCGGADQAWNSCAYAQAIIGRLDAAHDPYPHELAAYLDAGHGIGSPIPYEPTANQAQQTVDGVSVNLSGTAPEANPLALAQLWPRLLAFLAANS